MPEFEEEFTSVGSTTDAWRALTSAMSNVRFEYTRDEALASLNVTPPVPEPEPLYTCAHEGCDAKGDRNEMIRSSTRWWCGDHIVRCSSCSARVARARLHTIRRISTGREVTLCTGCTTVCNGCGDRNYYGDVSHTNHGYRCVNCREICEECSNYFATGEECHYCEDQVRGLNGYAKTYPTHWLGGPLPKDKKGIERGYYLGFELEVTARKGHVRPLNEWAQENIGHYDALECKEDSSVTGFEIATQPMTPKFFESVNWDDFFQVLNNTFPLPNRKRTESENHGLHVHIGKIAFANDDIAMAAFCYLIGQSSHLERIARRKPTSYCVKVKKPVSATIAAVNHSTGRHRVQAVKARAAGVYAERSAINLLNSSTIEIRAFRSTRKAQDLKDAVRLVYVAAEYIRHLRFEKPGIPPRALHWTEFVKWVGGNYPEAFESISGMKSKRPVR